MTILIITECPAQAQVKLWSLTLKDISFIIINLADNTNNLILEIERRK